MERYTSEEMQKFSFSRKKAETDAGRKADYLNSEEKRGKLAGMFDKDRQPLEAKDVLQLEARGEDEARTKQAERTKSPEAQKQASDKVGRQITELAGSPREKEILKAVRDRNFSALLAEFKLAQEMALKKDQQFFNPALSGYMAMKKLDGFSPEAWDKIDRIISETEGEEIIIAPEVTDRQAGREPLSW